MKYILILFTVTSLFVACGGGGEKPQTLEEKKTKLNELRTELTKVSKEIEELENDIAESDPEANKVVTVPVQGAPLETITFRHYVNVQGQVESNRNVLVSPKASGIITKMNVREGQSVRAGQILAQVDDALMRSNLDELRTQLELATTLYEKQKRLWDKEIGTEVQYLQAKNNKESMERRLATLEEQLDMSKIKSPITGVVDQIQPKLGEMVSPGMPAFRIVNPSDLSLNAQLSEAYVPFIKRGESVKVNFPSLNKNMDAKVSVVGQSVDPTSRTFEVEVKLPGDKNVKVNMFGELSINDRTVEEAICVPLYILQKAELGNYVYVAEKGEDDIWYAKRKNVIVGLSYDGLSQIESGLKAGEIIITDGYKDLSDGQAIDLIQSVATTE
jgi:RND family efflux transporter MFP subunit